MKRIIGIFIAAVILLPITAKAAGSGSIYANDTVVNGNEVTATVTLSNVAAWDVKISCSGNTNDKSTHEVGDSGNGNNTTKKFYLTCKATSTGSITFNFSGDVTSSDGQNTGVSGSRKVTVVKPREKSSNNNLKSLSIEGYELKPAFNKDTLEYTVEVTDDAEKIKINAEKEDGYASVTGDGEVEVVEGVNNLEVKVTSETGDEKVYKLTVNVKDNNPITEKINGTTYTVVKRSKALVLPEALDKEKFTENKVTINEIEVPVYVSEEYKLTLIGLADEKGNVYLFKYENNKITEKYEILTSKSITVVFKDAKDIPEGYTKTTIKINGKEYTAYKKDKNSDYALIYGTELTSKEDKWYSYNLKENSIQSYDRETIDKLNKDHTKELDEYKMYTYILAGVSGFFLLVIILLIILKGKNKDKKPKDKKPKDKVDYSIYENAVEPDTIEKELEDTKEIDATEIIIDKEKEEVPEVTLSTMVKVEEPIEPKKDKKKKKKNKDKVPEEPTKSEFLNTQDLEEILDNEPIKEQVEQIKKEVSLEETDEMDMTFFDDYKGKKKKNRK